jgi:hypothetical protein
MPISHPHAEATYRVLALDDGGFGVEVSIPDTHPTTVTKFASKEAAEAWIAAHRERVQSQAQSGRRAFRGATRSN